MPRPKKVKLPEPTRSTDKDLFPHEPTFTYRIALRLKKNTPGTTVAWFSCKEHAHKYIERYKPNILHFRYYEAPKTKRKPR